MARSTNPRPTTPAQFRRQAEAGFRRSNPDAKGATVTWEWSRRVTFPTGVKGFTGSMAVAAPGFAPATMMAVYTEGGMLTVR